MRVEAFVERARRVIRRRTKRINGRFPSSIVVYRVDTRPNPSDLAAAMVVLDEDEQVEVHRYRQPSEQSCFAFRRAARHLLWHELATINEGPLRFDRRGCPYSQSGWRGISFSSDADCAVLAFSRDCQVGVDIELIRPIPDMRTIAELAFSDAERASLLASLPSQRTKRFLEIWTLKEAWLKANGIGLPDTPRDVCSTAIMTGEGRDGGWLAADLSVGPDYVATISWAKRYFGAT